MSKKTFIFLVSGLLMASAFSIVQAAPTFQTSPTIASSSAIIFEGAPTHYLDWSSYDGNAATASYAVTAGSATNAVNADKVDGYDLNQSVVVGANPTFGTVNASSVQAVTGSGQSVLGSNASGGYYAGYDASGNYNSLIRSYASIGVQAYFLAGNVGIGLSNPGYKLDVQGGQINASGGLCIAGVCQTSWSGVGGQWTTSGTNIYNANTGNIGIGLTNPTYKFHVQGQGAFADTLTVSNTTINKNLIYLYGDDYNKWIGYSGHGLHIGTTDYAHDALYFGPQGSTSGTLNSMIYFNWADATPTRYNRWMILSTPVSGNIYGYANDGSTVNTLISSTENSYFNIGNVGIGATAPGAKLEISTVINNDGIKISHPTQSLGTNGGAITFDAYTNTAALINVARIKAVVTGGGVPHSGELQFYTDNSSVLTQHMVIKSTGNVGIGTTAPAQSLTVGAGVIGSVPNWPTIVATGPAQTGVGAGINNKLIYLFNNGTIMKLDAYNYASSTAMDVQIGGNGGDVIIPSGNVGIGTTNPGIMLQVRSDSLGTWGGRMGLANATADKEIFFGTYGSIGGVFAHNNALNAWADLYINTVSGTTGMVVKGDGNVGIGTTAPDATLDVVGSVKTGASSASSHYQNVLSYYVGTGAQTGTVKIVMPKGWSNTMMHVVIKGYSYASSSAWSVTVGGYNYATNSAWYNYTAKIDGPAPFSQVRLGYDGTRNVILLGNTSTAWSYTTVEVSDIITTYGNVNGWGTGWSGALLTSEAGLTAIVTPTIYTYINTLGNLGIGTATPTAKLELAGVSAYSMLAGGGKIGNVASPTLDADVATKAYVDSVSGSGGYWTANGTEIYSNNTGNVGIGVTSPVSKLAVAGSVQAYSISLFDTAGNAVIGTPGGDLATYADNTGLFGYGDGAIYVSGNFVGISTTTPANKLDINTGSTAEGISLDGRVALTGWNGDTWLRLNQSGSWGSGVYTPGSIRLDGSLQVGSSGATLSVTSGGNFVYRTNVLFANSTNVGIGTTTPSHKLTVVGDIEATSFIYTSDRNLKKNIKTLDNSLAKILQLRGVSFDWEKDNKSSVGLIAQEVEKIYPELVSGPEGGKGVQYGNLVAPLIEAVKEQQKKINSLEIKVKSLGDLEARVRDLEEAGIER